MRILIENSGYHLENMGDVAMLQVTVARLRNFWPDALIEVITNAPEKLAELCPQTHPLLPIGRCFWTAPLISSIYKSSTSQLTLQWSDIEEWEMRHYSPYLVGALIKTKLKKTIELFKYFTAFKEAVDNADLVVASGGGYITDVFQTSAILALDTLGLASRLGKPTAMLGHGLGPLWKQNSLTKAKAVLPFVNVISLREKRAGIPLLKSMGISQERVFTTGDDAIELAYKARCLELGNGIGANLRVSKYSSISLTILEIVRSALQEVAKSQDAQLIAAPISRFYYKGYEDSDSMTIQKLLNGYENTADAGQYLDTPSKVIEQIGQCRVVVTGSYHAGVFALAQGIPVVCLAKSEYYIDKFLGLADQFGIGCTVVLLNDRHLREKLIISIDAAWKSAEHIRPQLLDAAKKQIQLGHDAYKRVYELVQSR
ncbi:MAG: polysaccharide pyruvyl transferase family protein [Nostoc sp. DcaGUA01]|nr:polysaccharide pyruvyl transferase family protein [Nostoc sp. DcaGUA01]